MSNYNSISFVVFLFVVFLQNTILQKELASSKLDQEKQLKHIASLGEEKKILMDIIKHLCMETGRQIDFI